MIEIKLYGTKLQRDFLFCQARYIGYFAGRRYGKTVNIRNRAIMRCWTKANFKYAFMAPIAAQTKKQYDAIAENRALAPLIFKAPKKPYRHIVFKNGSIIEFRTLKNPDNIRGEEYDEAAVDEIQDVPEEVVDKIIIPCLRGRRGTLIVSGQFRGHNWYYEKYFAPGQAGKRGHASFAISTEHGLDFMDAEGQAEWADIKANTPAAVFRQEYLCVPTDNERAAFPAEQVDRCTGGELLTEPVGGRRYVMGLDIGKVKDPTAVVILDAWSGLIAHAEKFPIGMEHEEQAARAARIAAKWRAPCFVDTTGGATGGNAQPDEYVKFYRQKLPEMRAVWFSPSNKEKLIEALSLAVEQKRLIIPAAAVELIREIKNYEAIYTNGRWRYNAAKGQHDDYVAALAMAYSGRVYYPQQAGIAVGAVLG